MVFSLKLGNKSHKPVRSAQVVQPDPGATKRHGLKVVRAAQRIEDSFTLVTLQFLRACLSVRFQGFTPTPQYRPSASSRLWPARPAVLCLPDPCGLGFDSHGGKVFSGKLLEFLTQTGSQRGSWRSHSRSTEPGCLPQGSPSRFPGPWRP